MNRIMLKPRLVADEAISSGLALKLGTGLALDDGAASNVAQAAIKFVGVSLEDVAAAAYCNSVVVEGECSILLGGTVTQNARLTVDTTGRFVELTSLTLVSGTLYYVAAIALEPGTVGQRVNAILTQDTVVG